MFESKGIIRYGPGVRLVAEIDQEISNYYFSLIPKYYCAKPQAYKAHITIVRLNKENPTKIEKWNKYEGEIISFFYDPFIQNDERYFWINAYSDEIGKIREELGLPRFRDDSWLQGGIKRNEYHITIGNIK